MKILIEVETSVSLLYRISFVDACCTNVVLYSLFYDWSEGS